MYRGTAIYPAIFGNLPGLECSLDTMRQTCSYSTLLLNSTMFSVIRRGLVMSKR